MPSIDAHDLDRMRSNLLFDGADSTQRLTRFWVLLVLSSCIASAGVVADSTATVIGAMIVAPLMTPIMGTVLSITTSDRANLVRSVTMIVAGAATAIFIGYLFGLLSPVDVLAESSSQVSGRVSPRLIDLAAAVATGAAGAFAQCREDVSDTLPGVAIAISLVPPLAVVGLTLEGGAPGQSWGALLLFLTNVAAILFTGVFVMASFGVHAQSVEGPGPTLNRRRAVQVVVALVAVLTIPLGFATASFTSTSIRSARIADIARDWSEEYDWKIVNVEAFGGGFEVLATGPQPNPEHNELRTALDEAGYSDVDVTLHLVPEERIVLTKR